MSDSNKIRTDESNRNDSRWIARTVAISAIWVCTAAVMIVAILNLRGSNLITITLGPMLIAVVVTLIAIAD